VAEKRKSKDRSMGATAQDLREPVGLIGLGLLGSAVAARLHAAGKAVWGYDLSPQRQAILADMGMTPQPDAAAVVRACAVVVLCLPDSRVVRQVVHGQEGALKPGQLFLDMTTGDPQDSAALAGWLAARGAGLVEAPVIGSSEQLRRGEARFLVSGRPEHVAQGWPVLEAMACPLHVLPEGCQAACLKLVVNLVLGLNRAALAEGLALAEACGLPLDDVLAVLRHSPAYARIMDSKGPKMLARDYTPQAHLAQHLKDVRLIRELAARQGAVVPLSQTHEQLLARAVELGWGEADNSALVEVYRAAAAQGRRDELPQS
jgi:3-hydroxyisobutyrate dehydrogenase-like beta-hydroxyacid dehydrogenase